MEPVSRCLCVTLVRFVRFFVARFLAVFFALVVFLAGLLPDRFAGERFELALPARFLVVDFRVRFDFFEVFLETILFLLFKLNPWHAVTYHRFSCGKVLPSLKLTPLTAGESGGKPRHSKSGIDFAPP
jgi:hypothetical protein